MAEAPSFDPARVPVLPAATPDEGEAVEALWARPADALARFEASEWPMMPPTVGMLKLLASYATSEDVLAAAADAGTSPELHAKLESIAADPGWRVLLPHESDYANARADEMYSWIRLPPAAAI